MKQYQLYIELDLISTPHVPHSCSYSHGVDVDIIVITAPPQPRGRIILHLLVSIFKSIYILAQRILLLVVVIIFFCLFRLLFNLFLCILLEYVACS